MSSLLNPPDISDENRCVDKPGLLLKSHGDKLTPAQVEYARDDSEWEGNEGHDLLAVIKGVKPHVLIGTSTRTPPSLSQKSN
jgi:malic enzyme